MKLTLTTIAAMLLTTTVHATAWDVENEDGSWSPNPDCTGECREDGIPDSEREPTPQPEPEKPAKPGVDEPTKDGQNSSGAGHGRAGHATPDQHWTGTCRYDAASHTVHVHTAAFHNPAKARQQCFEKLKAEGKF